MPQQLWHKQNKKNYIAAMLKGIVFCSPDFAESFAGSTLAKFDTKKKPKNHTTLRNSAKMDKGQLC